MKARSEQSPKQRLSGHSSIRVSWSLLRFAQLYPYFFPFISILFPFLLPLPFRLVLLFHVLSPGQAAATGQARNRDLPRREAARRLAHPQRPLDAVRKLGGRRPP